MARKPLSFDHLTLVNEDSSTQAVERISTPTRADAAPQTESLKEASAHLMTYISPEAAKAFARYALDQSTHRNKVKVHDLCIEAYEMWFRSKGIQVEVRANRPGTTVTALSCA